MQQDKLVAMANQIAAFFRAYPEAEARAGIRDHIEAFWTPSMRQVMLSERAPPGLDPLVVKALWSHTEAESPILKEVAGPDEVGQLASDAG